MPTPIAHACAACLRRLADTGREGPQQMGDIICPDGDAMAPDGRTARRAAPCARYGRESGRSRLSVQRGMMRVPGMAQAEPIFIGSNSLTNVGACRSSA